MQVKDETVPSITITGRTATSTAARPRHIADHCASWKQKDRNAAKRLLMSDGEIVCNDATAYAAMIAMSLEIMNRGRMTKGKLVIGY